MSVAAVSKSLVLLWYVSIFKGSTVATRECSIINLEKMNSDYRNVFYVFFPSNSVCYLLRPPRLQAFEQNWIYHLTNKE